jgi:hypothetical protein
LLLSAALCVFGAVWFVILGRRSAPAAIPDGASGDSRMHAEEHLP